MSERELFEHNFPKPKDIYWCEELNDYNYIDKGRGNPYAYDNLISYRLAWKSWQAAKAQAVLEGFVVIPKEPTKEMIHIGESTHYGYDNIDSKHCYIAMIGAVE